MRSGGSKSKGSSFERIISRLLSQWITGNKKEELFWRSAASGAKATIGRKKGIKSNQDGDISSTSVKSHWLTREMYFECKNYKAINVIAFFHKSGDVYSWWCKTFKEAQESNKFPILIFKGNRTIIYAMVTRIFWSKMDSYLGLKNFEHIRIHSGHDVVIFNFMEFLDHYDAKIFKTFLEES